MPSHVPLNDYKTPSVSLPLVYHNKQLQHCAGVNSLPLQKTLSLLSGIMVSRVIFDIRERSCVIKQYGNIKYSSLPSQVKVQPESFHISAISEVNIYYTLEVVSNGVLSDESHKPWVSIYFFYELSQGFSIIFPLYHIIVVLFPQHIHSIHITSYVNFCFLKTFKIQSDRSHTYF